MRFYLDADSAHASLVRELRRHGVDVETAVEVGLRDALDPLQVSHALTTGRVLVTGDVRLRQAMIDATNRGASHPGVVLLQGRKRQDVGKVLQSLLLIDAAYQAEDMVDQFLFAPF